MTDAPEQVWIDHMPHEHHWHESAPIEGSQYAHEFSGPYIRADIHQEALQAAYAEGLEAAAVGAVSGVARGDGDYRARCDAVRSIRALPNKYEVK